MGKNLWSREHLILAFNLYLKLPFGKMHQRNPEIIQLANLLERTPSSIAMRLGNFASCDPYLQARGIAGLKGGMNQVKPIWDEFYTNQEELVFRSEEILAAKEHTSVPAKFHGVLSDLGEFVGEEKQRLVKTRVNQAVFRTMVLSNYNFQCCITGIPIPELLVASHIVPWSRGVQNRLNPRNGLCLNALHDKAFDKGLLTITADFKIKLSSAFGDFVKESSYQEYFSRYDGKQIMVPKKFVPDQDFLAYHQEQVFVK